MKNITYNLTKTDVHCAYVVIVYNAGHVDESVAFTRWTCEQERKKRATILVGSSERMDFIATSIGQSKAPPSK